MTRTLFAAAVFIVTFSAVAVAQKERAPRLDNYDETFKKYLEAARQQAPANLWMTGLFEDRRARRVNDLVTISVRESTFASGTADSSTSKDSSASAGIPSLFGAEGKLPSFITPANLVGASSNTGFKGTGATTRAGELTANITARVAEVMPNGDLVLEGVREIEVNGDRQIVVLTGIARPTDIGPGNVLASAAIGQMRIRYFGNGLMKDSLSPGWLVRILNKIF